MKPCWGLTLRMLRIIFFLIGCNNTGTLELVVNCLLNLITLQATARHQEEKRSPHIGQLLFAVADEFAGRLAVHTRETNNE